MLLGLYFKCVYICEVNLILIINMHKCLLSFFLVAMLSASPCASRSVAVHTSGPDSGPRVFELTDDLRLSFDSGNLCVSESPTASSELIPLSEVGRITFEDFSGLENVSQRLNDLEICYSRPMSNLSFEGWLDGELAPVVIYSVSGAVVLSMPSHNGESIDVASLEPGLYIVNAKGVNYKFVK